MEEIKYQKLIHSILLENVDTSIVNKINAYINVFLKSNDSIQTSVSRARALTDNIIIIDYHAILNESNVLELLKSFLNDPIFVEEEIYSKVKDDPRIPVQNFLSNSQSGGNARDEFNIIDPKARLLVDALNSIPGFYTFSSCEGHYQSPFYVMWVIPDNDVSNLNQVAKLLITIGNNIFMKHGFTPNQLDVRLLFGYDTWSKGSKNGYLEQYSNIPYFEFRITPKIYTPWPESFYEFTNELSEEFSKAVKEAKWKPTL